MPYLKGVITHNFRNFDLSVSMGQLRSIQIFVVGQARRPGSYTVSSLSTLVNAVFYSGGPLNTGSMRRIQLRRGDSVVVEFDLYDLLLRGDKSKDDTLLPGDVIFIPPVGPEVAIGWECEYASYLRTKREDESGGRRKAGRRVHCSYG